MNAFNFSFDSSGYQQSFFDFENKENKNITDLLQGDGNEVIPCENVEIGFSDSEIKDLAEEISDKLIVLVKNQLER